jgi:hypothetical protein
MSALCQKQTLMDYSITASARTSSDDGTLRSSAFAVLRLATVSYLVGACTGRSAGLARFSALGLTPDQRERKKRH